jgi:hypothetical protein
LPLVDIAAREVAVAGLYAQQIHVPLEVQLADRLHQVQSSTQTISARINATGTETTKAPIAM